MVVNLLNHLLDVSIRNVHLLFLDDVTQFRGQNHTTAVFIKSLELLSELLNLILSGHLDKHVHGSSLEMRNTLEALQSFKHFVTHDVFFGLRSKVHFEPWMLKSLLSREAFLLIDNEQLSNQVSALTRHHFELRVLKVEVGFFNLAENFSGSVALERQVARDETVE